MDTTLRLRFFFVCSHKLLSLLYFLHEAGQGFGQLICPNYLDGIFLDFDIVDCPIGPKDKIHHLQGYDLAEPCEMVPD